MKLRIGRVVDQADAVGRVGNQIDDIALGGAGDGDDALGALETAPQTEDAGGMQQAGGIVVEQTAQIVDGHQVRLAASAAARGGTGCG